MMIYVRVRGLSKYGRPFPGMARTLAACSCLLPVPDTRGAKFVKKFPTHPMRYTMRKLWMAKSKDEGS